MHINQSSENRSQRDLLKEQQEFFQNILDCIYDRIYVTDKNGVVIMINKAVERDNDDNQPLVGRKMSDLVKEGYMTESLSLKILQSKKSQGHIHHEEAGYDLLSWGTPCIENGEVQFVVCTEWDMKSLDTMQAFLSEERGGLPSNVKSELTYYRMKSSMSTEIIAKSNSMKELLKIAEKSARSDATVLIQGESGTGKEVLMRYIHNKGPRINAPLIEINCGAIPENLIESELFGYVRGAFTGADSKGKAGLFELANLGTIFLDEIEALPLQSQAKILRVLQEKEVTRVGGHVSLPVDIKIIAATNVDLEELIEKKLFREDLFYRLNVLPLSIPPLRNRKADIVELIKYFTNSYNFKYKMHKSIQNDDLELFLKYEWPGNVRELQNIIERAILTTQEDVIPRSVWERQLKVQYKKKNEVFSEQGECANLKNKVEEYEKELILANMHLYKNSRQFAKLMGVEKSTINRKLKKYGLKPLEDLS